MTKSPQEVVAYNRAGASAATGVPAQTLDKAIKDGELPAMTSGRQRIILKADLIAWLLKCKQQGSIPAPVSDADRERFAALNKARKQAA
jgi:excisionase family DNA binding protein